MGLLLPLRHTRRECVTVRPGPSHIPQHWVCFTRRLTKADCWVLAAVCALLCAFLVYFLFVTSNFSEANPSTSLQRFHTLYPAYVRVTRQKVISVIKLSKINRFCPRGLLIRGRPTHSEHNSYGFMFRLKP